MDSDASPGSAFCAQRAEASLVLRAIEFRCDGNEVDADAAFHDVERSADYGRTTSRATKRGDERVAKAQDRSLGHHPQLDLRGPEKAVRLNLSRAVALRVQAIIAQRRWHGRSTDGFARTIQE